MVEAFPDRTVVNDILLVLVEGRPAGAEDRRRVLCVQQKASERGQPDPKLDELIQPLMRGKRKFSDDEVEARLFLPMVLEATRLLDDKVVRDVRDVDLGLIYGIGFPPFKGGLLFWADTLGAAKIVEMLKPLEPLGERARPTPLLLDMAPDREEVLRAGCSQVVSHFISREWTRMNANREERVAAAAHSRLFAPICG